VVVALIALALLVAGVIGLLVALRRRNGRLAGDATQADAIATSPDRRAEQRARALLHSCVNEEEWAMYRDLGFIRVPGTLKTSGAQPAYAYLVYPHKPVVAYLPATGRLLNEYCVEFPDLAETVAGSRLPASDDVLAKWMGLTGGERRLIASAQMHLPGRQLDPARVRRDLWRLREWERQRRTGSAKPRAT
jgi:hypothetical protein